MGRDTALAKRRGTNPAFFPAGRRVNDTDAQDHIANNRATTTATLVTESLLTRSAWAKVLLLVISEN